jgi:hypothetical protein
MTRPAGATVAVFPVRDKDHELMIDVQREAERLGLVLVTDGRDLAYTLPHHIPPGWTRFALVDKNAGRLDPREIKDGKT